MASWRDCPFIPATSVPRIALVSGLSEFQCFRFSFSFRATQLSNYFSSIKEAQNDLYGLHLLIYIPTPSKGHLAVSAILQCNGDVAIFLMKWYLFPWGSINCMGSLGPSHNGSYRALETLTPEKGRNEIGRIWQGLDRRSGTWTNQLGFRRVLQSH